MIYILKLCSLFSKRNLKVNHFIKYHNEDRPPFKSSMNSNKKHICEDLQPEANLFLLGKINGKQEFNHRCISIFMFILCLSPKYINTMVHTT